VHPHVPLWKRRLAAVCELSLGIVYDVVLFWRSFLRPGSPIQNPHVRARIKAELALIVCFWGVVLAATAWFDRWTWLLVVYVIPAVVAGNMHSLRKYVEHMGLTGSSILGLTRTVVPTSPLGRLLAFSMFNISYHAVHHYYGAMPQASLPTFTSLLTPRSVEERPSYRNYRSAFFDMVPTLANPRVGPQWNCAAPQCAGVESLAAEAAPKRVPAQRVYG
jgi:fatty acid desaturase